MSGRKRLLLIEDHQMVGESFRNMLEPEFRVDGPYGDGRLVPGLVRDSQPDMVLLDLELRHRNGADLIAELREVAKKTFILVVTVETRPEIMEDVLSRGAHGFVPKGAGFEELRVAIAAVFDGQIYRSPYIQRVRWQRPVHPHDEAIREFDDTRRRIDMRRLLPDVDSRDVDTMRRRWVLSSPLHRSQAALDAARARGHLPRPARRGSALCGPDRRAAIEDSVTP
jgi:DNA-binding NarL/FixJ family response regulator